MAMIMRDALNYQVFRDIINTSEYTIKKINKRKKPFYSTQRHKMVLQYSSYYYDGIIGGKTGFTNESGTTLVTAAQRDGMTLIAVVLNSNGDHVYIDTTALFDYGFENFHMANVSENDSRFKSENSLTLQSPFTTTNSSVYIDKEASIVIPKKVKFSKLSSEISFNLSDDSFATISYKYGSKELGTADIKYTNKISQSETETTALETTTSETISSENPVTQNSSASAENITSSSDTQNITTAKQNNYSPKSTFKIPKILLPILLGIIVFIIIIVILILERRKLNKIRAMKRNRNRD
jgi:D-alanyl-D-alanine carboxypeptidase